MKVLKNKWSWSSRFPLIDSNLLGKIHSFVSPDPTFNAHDGYSLHFVYYPVDGDFGYRSFKKKFKTWRQANNAGKRALRFIALH